MAKKSLEPDEAFGLLGQQTVNKTTPSRDKQRDHQAPDYDLPNPPRVQPRWLQYTLYFVASLIAIGFISILGYAGYLLYNQNKSTQAQAHDSAENQIKAISPDEAKSMITSNLTQFLLASSVDEKLKFVQDPEGNRNKLQDYYTKRLQADSSLWKIIEITPSTYDAREIWMVAYQNVVKQTRYASFIREQNDILLHWPSTYAYGELSWENFILKQPTTPVQMRAYAIKHGGIYPHGISKDTHICLTIEDSDGLATELAVMSLESEGADKLAKIPKGARIPVNLKLFYTKTANGNKRLEVHELIHFQWIRQSSHSTQHPVMLNADKR